MNDFFHKTISRRDFLTTVARIFSLLGLSSIFPACAQTESTSDETGTVTAIKTVTKTPVVTETETLVPESGAASSDFEPAYLQLHNTGELKERAEELWAVMESCQLCPRRCRVNRLEGMSGFCRVPGDTVVISASHPHFGEEKPLVGRGGSGTIFMTHCNLRCVFCQNWEISHLGRGAVADIDKFARMMLRLQHGGCHNINIVTPTSYSPHILKAIDVAAGQGLRIPIVYNTSGWERLEILSLLDGVVDIYLPDFKYWNSDMSAKFSAGAESYPEMARAAILEMNRQVGVAKPAKDGIMHRGLMIRHLVMPNDIGGSELIMEWIAQNLPTDTYVNIMAQYTPAHKAYDYPELSRRITNEEYQGVVHRAQDLGLTNLDIQGYWWLR
jgi:putative pyruvate formate lyase activating enzyme